jgi:guanylate kinase
MMISEKFVLIVSGPSGVGKTTICSRFLEEHKNFSHPVSVTTRLPRDYEINGQHYNFVTTEQYDDMMLKNQLLEAVEIYGNKYGTQSLLVEAQLAQHNLIFNVDSNGMHKIKDFFKGKANVLTIFILPPSIGALCNRIEFRGDSADNIKERNERAFYEIQNAKDYDCIIMNDDLETAQKQFFAIYDAFFVEIQRKYLLKIFE